MQMKIADLLVAVLCLLPTVSSIIVFTRLKALPTIDRITSTIEHVVNEYLVENLPNGSFMLNAIACETPGYRKPGILLSSPRYSSPLSA
jgi:hypothetical protein